MDLDDVTADGGAQIDIPAGLDLPVQADLRTVVGALRNCCLDGIDQRRKRPGRALALGCGEALHRKPGATEHQRHQGKLNHWP
jgi:hypothetical protein